MSKAIMVTLDTHRLKGLLKEKNMSVRTLAENLGYSASWGKRLISTGYVKQQTVVAIAKQLGIQASDLYPSDLVSAAPEAPASEETDIMADIDKACRLIVSKALEALEKSAGCIQIEAVANAVSTVHNILVSKQAQKELRETMNKLLETHKPSECSGFGIGTIPNSKP